jgi:hypothetical protein
MNSKFFYDKKIRMWCKMEWTKSNHFNDNLETMAKAILTTTSGISCKQKGRILLKTTQWSYQDKLAYYHLAIRNSTCNRFHTSTNTMMITIKSSILFQIIKWHSICKRVYKVVRSAFLLFTALCIQCHVGSQIKVVPCVYTSILVTGEYVRKGT